MKRIGTLMLASALCIALLCGTGLAEQSGGYVNPNFIFDLFVEEIQAGHYDKALDLYHENEEMLANSAVIPEFPTYADYAQGLLLLQNGQLDEALAGFQRVHRIMVGSDTTASFPNTEGLPDITALITYTQARIDQRDSRPEEAIAGYEKVRPFIHIRIFADVLSRMGECYAILVPTQLRYSVASSSADTNRFTFSWNDSENASGYTVSWKPNGAGTATSLETGLKQIQADNLLPNTTYQITVIAVEDQGSPLVATVTTERAKSLSGAITLSERASLWTYEARRLDLYTLDELRTDGFLSEPEKTEEGANIIRVTPYYAAGLKRYELHAVLRNTDSSRSDMTYTLILRMPDDLGTYSVSEKIDAPSTRYSRGMIFPFDLTNLLSQYFGGQDGMWVESAGTIELYIDGMYVDALPVTFELD